MLSSQTRMFQYTFAPFNFREYLQYASFIISSTVVDQCVDAHSKSMTWIVICLSWSWFGDNHEFRDAAKIVTPLANCWGALIEPSDDLCRCNFAFPPHRFDRWKFLGATGVPGDQFVGLRLVPEFHHDYGAPLYALKTVSFP